MCKLVDFILRNENESPFKRRCVNMSGDTINNGALLLAQRRYKFVTWKIKIIDTKGLFELFIEKFTFFGLS